MCFYIGIEDLAANALIEILRRDETKRFVTYEELENYGTAVVKLLSERGEEAVLILSRDNTNIALRNYSGYFYEKTCMGKEGIALRENISVEDLIKKFRGWISFDVLRAFVNIQTVGELGVLNGTK